MRKKYIVTLTTDERSQLLELIKKGTVAAQKVTRAHGLGHMILVIPGKKYLRSAPRLCYTHS